MVDDDLLRCAMPMRVANLHDVMRAPGNVENDSYEADRPLRCLFFLARFRTCER